MNDPEDQFQELSQLLKLKRHEQPPPGYLDRLPSRILARLEAEEAARNQRPAWLQRLVGTPARVTFGLGAAAALVLTASLWMPDPASDAGVALTTAGGAAAPVAMEVSPIGSEPLGIPVSELMAGGTSANPLAPVMAPDTAPAGLFNPSGFLVTSNSPGAERVSYDLLQR